MKIRAKADINIMHDNISAFTICLIRTETEYNG